MRKSVCFSLLDSNILFPVVHHLSPIEIKSKYLQCVKWQDNQNSIYRSIQFTYLAFKLHRVNTNIYTFAISQILLIRLNKDIKVYDNRKLYLL